VRRGRGDARGDKSREEDRKRGAMACAAAGDAGGGRRVGIGGGSGALGETQQARRAEAEKTGRGIGLVLGCRSKGKQCKRFEGETRSGSSVVFCESGGKEEGEVGGQRLRIGSSTPPSRKFKPFKRVQGTRAIAVGAQHGFGLLCKEPW